MSDKGFLEADLINWDSDDLPVCPDCGTEGVLFTIWSCCDAARQKFWDMLDNWDYKIRQPAILMSHKEWESLSDKERRFLNGDGQ